MYDVYIILNDLATMPTINITPKLVASATCPQEKRHVDFFDTQCKGLLLEVRVSGGKTWYLRYTNARGKTHQFRLGDVRDLPLDMARKRADELRLANAMGRDPADEKAALRSVPTFADFVSEKYLPFAKISKRSWDADDSYLRNHLVPAFGKKTLDSVTKQQVINFHHGMLAKGYAPGTCNRCLILLRYIYNLAIDWETPGVTKNPTRKVQLLKNEIRHERYLSRDEAHRLYQALECSDNPQLKFIVPLLLLTGVRKRELLDAKWKDVDFENHTWNIPRSKTGFRAIPISDGTLAILKRIPRIPDSPYVVPNPETGRPYCSVYYSWNTARKQAGLADVRMHDLRHTFASFLVNNGRTLYEVQKLLGHTQIRTTMKYSHLAKETLLDAASTAVDALGHDFGPAHLEHPTAA